MKKHSQLHHIVTSPKDVARATSPLRSTSHRTTPSRPQARTPNPHQQQQPHLSQGRQGPSPSHHGYDERGGSTSVVIRRCLTSTTGTPPRRPSPGTQQRHARPSRARHAPHAHRRVPPAEGGAHGTTRQVRARGREGGQEPLRQGVPLRSAARRNRQRHPPSHGRPRHRHRARPHDGPQRFHNRTLSQRF